MSKKRKPQRIVRLKLKGKKKLSKDERKRLKKVIEVLNDTGADYEIDGEYLPEPESPIEIQAAIQENLKESNVELESDERDNNEVLGGEPGLAAVAQQYSIDQRRSRVVASQSILKSTVVFFRKIEVGAVVKWVFESFSGP